MPFRLTGYFLKKALEHLLVNPFLSLVTLSTITISLVIFGLFGVVYLSVHQLLNQWGDEFSVTVYLQDTVSQSDVEKMRSELARWPEVDGVTYTSKAQAMAWFRSQLQEYAGILDGLKENPLPASLDVKLRPGQAGPGTVDQLISRLQQKKRPLLRVSIPLVFKRRPGDIPGKCFWIKPYRTRRFSSSSSNTLPVP